MAVTGKLPARRGRARRCELASAQLPKVVVVRSASPRLPRAPLRGLMRVFAAPAPVAATVATVATAGERGNGGAGERPTGMRRAPVEDAAW